MVIAYVLGRVEIRNAKNGRLCVAGEGDRAGVWEEYGTVAGQTGWELLRADPKGEYCGYILLRSLRTGFKDRFLVAEDVGALGLRAIKTGPVRGGCVKVEGDEHAIPSNAYWLYDDSKAPHRLVSYDEAIKKPSEKRVIYPGNADNKDRKPPRLMRDRHADQGWEFLPAGGTGGWTEKRKTGWNARCRAWFELLGQDRAKAGDHERVGGFRTWRLHFDDSGALSNPVAFAAKRDRIEQHLMERARGPLKRGPLDRAPRVRHIFVFVHGVGTDFGPFGSYLERMADLHAELDLKAHGIAKEHIDVVGITWRSQSMGGMLGSLLSPGTAMPAKRLAEGDLRLFIDKIASYSNTKVHLVAHSMGAQVLLYLLPALAPRTRIASMLFIQGFAPSSAFAPRQNVPAKLQGEVKALVQTGLDKHANFDTELTWAQVIAAALIPTGVGFLAGMIGTIGLIIARNVIGDQKAKILAQAQSLVADIVKETDFHKHLDKVSGRILATTTATLGADYQVGGALLSFYAGSGVLGATGFAGNDAAGLDLHDLDDDKAAGGTRRYSFDSGKRFFNLRAGSFITDHDDFKNRAVALAHMAALGLVPAAASIALKERLPRRPAKRIDADRWMGETWSRIGGHCLTDISLPGAHDAGMSRIAALRLPPHAKIEQMVSDTIGTVLLPADEVRKGMAGLAKTFTARPAAFLVASGLAAAQALVPRLTLTQIMPIAQQLEQGCRYFDLRPALTDSGDFSLAHGDPFEGLGYIGGVGEKLSDVLSDIRAFAAAPKHGQELVILNFSHLANWKTGKALTADELKELVALVKTKLGRRMIVRPRGSHVALEKLPLDKLVADDRNVLCLFDPRDGIASSDVFKGNGGDATDQGIFWWYGVQDLAARQPLRAGTHNHASKGTTPCHFTLYDDYSNSRNSAYVIGTQRERYKQRMALRAEAHASNALRQRVPSTPPGPPEEVFLLSWTMTLAPNPSLLDMKSILDHATAFNEKLQPTMERWIQDGRIKGTARPNIVYVDAYDRRILDTVLMLNATVH